MKWMLLLIGLVNLFYVKEYTSKINKIENLIFEAYTHNFYEFLSINEKGGLDIDECLVKEYLKKEGYESQVIKENNYVTIIVEFKLLKQYKKDYQFYLGVNYE